MKTFANGRFEVVKKLGQGAQGLVYLAHDTQLDREVAIKILHSRPAQGADEARVMSRLLHPNIVTLYDAFAENGHPCLVFEYVDGETLAQRIGREGAMKPVLAVRIMLGVLEGLQRAHGAGLVHRDIKPQNIMLGVGNQPRIMDFGVAIPKGQQDPMLTGTAGYLSPEAIRNMPIGAGADVFACGVVLQQMLTGRLAGEDEGIHTTLYRTLTEQPDPPSKLNGEVDEKLDHLVLCALFKDPEQRFADAGAMRAALADWLEGYEVGDAAAGEHGDGLHSTVEFLLRRMRHTADFPALSQTISAINRIGDADSERVQNLSEVILGDFSLTNKLLKIVNSASFGQFGGAVSTISRAIVILGFDAIRNLAITLLLFEHMQNRAQAERLREAILQSFFGGVLAREIGLHNGWRDVEEVLICGMFQHLGRLLAYYYFGEETKEILKRAEQRNEAEHLSAQAVLGVDYRELGIAVAQSWNFPERISNSMRALPEHSLRAPGNQGERLRLFANLATDLIPLVSADPQKQSTMIDLLVRRYAPVLNWKSHDYQRAIKEAAQNYISYLSILGIDLGRGDFAKHLRKTAGLTELVQDSLFDARAAAADVPATALPEHSPSAMLAAGVQDITNTLMGEYQLNDLIRMILETMYRSIGFDRVLFCTRDPKRGRMQGRFGLGRDIDQIVGNFNYALEPVHDVFQLVLAKNADVLIEDINAESIAKRIPDWYRQLVDSETLMVFPLILDKKPLGLFYGDRRHAHSLQVPHDQLNLLKTLRNQALLAIKQKQLRG